MGLVSYVVMQVYEPSFLRKFRAIHHDLAYLQVFRFALVPSDYLLVRLADGQCSLSPDRRTLELGAPAYDIFKAFTSSKCFSALVEATKLLAKARRKSKDADE